MFARNVALQFLSPALKLNQLLSVALIVKVL
jgi:hypothetical protein